MSTKNEKVVYFILNPKYNIIKIGVSLDPFERLNAFKSIYGPQLNLLGFVKGGIEYEKKLHSIFKEYRIPLGMFDVTETEWFLFNEQVKKHIGNDLLNNKLSEDLIDRNTKLLIKMSTKNDLKDLKYDLRVDTFDEVISELIRKYKRGREKERPPTQKYIYVGGNY